MISQSQNINSARSNQSHSNEPIHRLSLTLNVTSLKDMLKPTTVVVLAEPSLAWGKVRSMPINVNQTGNSSVDLRATGLINVNKATLQTSTVNEQIVVTVEEEGGALVGRVSVSMKAVLSAKADTSNANVKKSVYGWMAIENEEKRKMCYL